MCVCLLLFYMGLDAWNKSIDWLIDNHLIVNWHQRTARRVASHPVVIVLSTLPSSPLFLRDVRREWALLSFHSVCLSVIPWPTAYHDWSITYLSSDPCKPFWIPYLPYFWCQRGKYAKFSPITCILATANVTHREIWLVFYPSLSSVRSRPLKSNRILRERCNLPSMVWDHSRNSIWCNLALKSDICSEQF